MKVIGVIIEANPFHNGHQYLIDKIKEENPNALLVAVCSGYFSMRGEISVLPKYEKTQILLSAGFDLVIDLPLLCSLNSSQKFAENSLYLLKQAKITDLYFGLEQGSVDELNRIINLENHPNYKNILSKNLNSEYSYKKAISKTILDLSNDQVIYNLSLLPNITLALDYLRIIKNFYPNVTPHSIVRIGEDDNSITLNTIPSGTGLREALNKNIDVDVFITYDSRNFINLNTSYQNISTLLNALLLKDSSYYKNFHLINEGIENYILNNININNTFEQNINLLANKKYTKSRIRRSILSMILELPKYIDEDIPFRVLGFSKNGEKHLKCLNDIKIYSNIKNINSKYYELELSASKLYNIITNKNTIINEYKFPIKEKNHE